jgi:DNA-binding NarL/FixJ family response regulator
LNQTFSSVSSIGLNHRKRPVVGRGLGELGLNRTVLIVDDNPLIRHSLRSWIEQDPRFRVSGEAENGPIAIDRVRELHPDIVILDLPMPVLRGLEAARQITRAAPRTSMVMLTIHCCEQLLKDARAAGIKAVVSKYDRLGDHLLAAINTSCA